MSESTIENDGAHIICAPMACKSYSGDYSSLVGGKCMECGKPMRNNTLLLTFGPNMLNMDAQCEKCGFNNRLLIATVTTLKCVPLPYPDVT